MANQLWKWNSHGEWFEALQAVTSTVFSIAVLARTGGVLQEIKSCLVPRSPWIPVWAERCCLKWEPQLREMGTWGCGYRGWAALGWESRGWNAVPKKAEGLHARTSQKHSSPQGFYSRLTDFFQKGHRPPACSSHFQQSGWIIWKTLRPCPQTLHGRTSGFAWILVWTQNTAWNKN